MPCRSDGWPTEDETNAKELRDVSAILCGVLTTLESYGDFHKIFNRINWSEVGVSELEAVAWWQRHKEQDRQRRLREEKERNHETIRRNAILKLTLEERDVLRVKL